MDEGTVANDYLGTSFPLIALLSDRFVEVLRAGGFTGWGTFPVTLTTQGGKAIDGYHGLAVRGRSGPIDGALSESIVLPPPVPGGAAEDGRRGLYFHPETWDGSDVFVPEGSGYVIVTEAVADAMRAAEVTNIDLEVLSGVERPVYR